MKLIVGLGNPGKEYEGTRHNIGFTILDAYVSDATWKEKNNGLYTEKMLFGEKVIFLKPLTFMNDSGKSVAPFASFFHIASEDILIVHDDMDLDVGVLRMKTSSGDGGHNGIKSIVEHLHTNEFCHMKIGIAHSPFGDTISHVLGKFTAEEAKILQEHMDDYKNAITSFIQYGAYKTMNDYNRH